MYTRTPETRVILCHARIVERVKNITQPIIRLLRVLKHKIENIATMTKMRQMVVITFGA